jgi:hypothetical protein
MKATPFLFLSALLTLSVATYPQSRGGGATSSQTSPAANPSAGPAASTDIGKAANWDALVRQGRPGDYLAGNVKVTGGALPWDPVPLTVQCAGKTRFTSTTDPKGNFVIAPTGTGASEVGSTEVKPKFAAQFVGCEVQAVLPGFDSSSLTIVNHNLLDDPNIGTIKLKREEGSAGAAVSSTTESAPKDAMKAFEKARTECKFTRNLPKRGISSERFRNLPSRRTLQIPTQNRLRPIPNLFSLTNVSRRSRRKPASGRRSSTIRRTSWS